MAETVTKHSMLQSKFPVDLPAFDELKLPKTEFGAFIKSLVAQGSSTTTALEDATSRLENAGIQSATEPGSNDDTAESNEDKPESAFMTGLLSDKATLPSLDQRDGKMLTANGDVALRTSGSEVVDLFYEMEHVISGDRLQTVLEKAWKADSTATLKLIWNARSIHLGKSSRTTFYRAVGWLYNNHPATLLANLPWLVRPLIHKKLPKKENRKDTEAGETVHVEEKDVDSDFEMIDEPPVTVAKVEPKKRKLDELEKDDDEYDIKYGVSHGYWKDLLNILTLAANDQLKVDGDPAAVFNVEKLKAKKFKRDWTEGRKRAVNEERHERAIGKLRDDPLYKALHLTVARLFVDQLRLDLARLGSGDKRETRKISLAGKWAPSNKAMHDQHTTIVTTIAENLHPFDAVCPQADPGDRTLYIKDARNAYQIQTLSKLRRHIQIVERPISEEKFEDIKYNRVPSLAMKQYTTLFAKKDFDRFDKYMEDVARGQAKVSGATLLPSTLVAEVMPSSTHSRGKTGPKNALVEQKIRDLRAKTLGGQWNTLVQRIKDSGTLTNSIAICDVSGSMSWPLFQDGTCPMHSSIGLSLLIAEITAPPFGGAFITFDDHPQVLQAGGADDKRTFAEKVAYISQAPWGGSTNFVSVFEDLILPMAVKNSLKPDEMVKQVFCFSDMQFNSASLGHERWTSSFERMKKKFAEHGYEVPKLVFWNLAGGRAGGRAGYPGVGVGDETAPKPVGAEEEETALVSGYSQGQLKMFLEGGVFGDEEEEEDVVEVGKDGEEVVRKKKADDPLEMVRKAIGHEAYRMLRVID